MSFRNVKEIIQDNKKGASELFFEAGESIISLNPDEAEKYAIELVQGRRSMSPLVNLANETFKAIERGNHRQSIKNYLLDVEQSKRKVIDEALEIVSEFNNIGTLSYSSTAIEVLRKSQNVSVLESRPLLEGRKTAEKLCNEGLDVIFYPDPAVYDMILEIDALLVGCDSLSNEAFTNKTGTYTAVLVCQNLKKPVYVVSDSSKILPKDIPLHFEEHHDPKEVWETELDITIHNKYFEKIPWMDHIEVITENGVIEKNEKIQSEMVSEKLLKHYPME
ncbi:MAG: hypothetical protein ACQEQM_03395 [Thermoplasmatota archaeon]